MVDKIQIRGARVHNLKNINVDIPLNKIVGVAGVSGSGKSSLALGVLYAEGSRRYLEALSTYTRRRMTQAAKADVDEVLYVPAALALHQRPGVPGIRSTFGTGTELLNSLRLMYSRLAEHRCPNGHYLKPALAVAAGQELVCPECGVHFYAPSAEELAFNSQGACRTCGGTGIVRTVDRDTLVPDESLTIEEGAVAPWNSLMWSLMVDVCREMGVRTDVPFRELTEQERDIVFDGPAEKKHIFYKAKNSNQAGELDFTYFNAVYTVENALSKVKDEKGMKRVEKFLKEEVCPDCGGSRLSEAARQPRLRGITLDEACRMTLTQLVEWVDGVPASLPEEMRPMAESICESFQTVAKRLMELGLGYLALDRAASTLSTGERQRMQLARAVRNRTTGVLYVLDEPSIGLHPSNILGLVRVMQDLTADGNSVLLVDHDTQILSQADWLIEMGPKAGADGGQVIAEGTVSDLAGNPVSLIGPFLAGTAEIEAGSHPARNEIFAEGRIRLSTGEIHTVHPLEVDIPKGRLTVITGVSGSGKSSLINEILYKKLACLLNRARIKPGKHKDILGVEQLDKIINIDQSPIGRTPRSNPATYTGVFDHIRELFAMTKDAKARGYDKGRFSFNKKGGRCEACAGDGIIKIEMNFLPDVYVPCEVCHGHRYNRETLEVKYKGKNIYEVLDMTVEEACRFFDSLPSIRRKIETLRDVGLGYIKLGQPSTTLSGGEAQRVKLATELSRQSTGKTIYVLDEPTTGLHFADVQKLTEILQRLTEGGNTVVVIEHNLEVIKTADYIIDMGPEGGDGGGTVVTTGTPEEVAAVPESYTGQYLKKYLA